MDPKFPDSPAEEAIPQEGLPLTETSYVCVLLPETTEPS
jgi:hypothetical protein